MPNGNVYCVPGSATTARIFNYRTGEVSTPPGTFPGNVAFVGGNLLPDGRIFLAPYNSTTARIVDVASGTITTPSGPAFPGSASFSGSILLPDGRTFVVPHLTNAARLVHTGAWGSVRLPTAVLTSPFLNKI
jgi:hypothetical protein